MTTPHTFGTAGARLIAEHVSPGHFGGFLLWHPESRIETIYAVDRDTGQALCRVDRIGCKEFDGDGWTQCDTVPADAEWIGNYPAPKARATLDAYANGTRIKLTGAIGGFQE